MAGKEMKGTVKWFSAKRGYGFLVDADGIDYFVHYNEIQSEGFKTLRNNMEVSFIADEDEKGRSIAKCVVPLLKETPKGEQLNEKEQMLNASAPEWEKLGKYMG